MTHRPFFRPIVLSLAAALLLGGCTRIGGKAAPPTAAPSLAPGTENVNPLGFYSEGGGHGGGQCPKASAAAWGCPSVYALSSDPSGITVQRFDPSGQTTQYNTTLTTPANDPLPDSSTNLQYRFNTPSANGQFIVTVQQVHDGPHQVYYNRNSDSVGKADVSLLPASMRRSTLSMTDGPALRAVHELARPVNKHAPSGIMSDRIYVRFRASALQANRRTVDDAIRGLGTRGRELSTTNSDPLTVVNVPAGTTAQDYAKQLEARPDVAATFAVHKRYTLSKSATTPNDADFQLPDEWYLIADGFPFAWSYTKGASATIAVIDTGVDLTNTDISQNVIFSETVLSGKSSTSEIDKDGHGTNVASIADAVANNGGAFGSGNRNFAGGGWSAKLIAISIFDPATGFASGSDEAIAIGDAVTHGADVINLSLGAEESFNDNQFTSASSWNGGYDEGEYEAIQAAIAANTTVVAAAGNNADGTDANGDTIPGTGPPPIPYKHHNLDYPAGYANVIAVGASALKDSNTGNYSVATEYVAPYSQSGVNLSVVAPGGDANATGTDPDILHWIWNYYSTQASSPCQYEHDTLPHIPTNCTALFNGTSQATPQVSAAAALLYAAAGGHHVLTPAQVKQLIEQTADNINDPNQGHGRLNIYRAIAALVQDPGATYTGPHAITRSATQMIAFAYTGGGNRPTIVDYDFPVGVPVAADGTFRIADVRPADATNFKVAVWYDANADGVIDAGDWIGTSAATCNVTSVCAIGTIKLTQVTGSYVLP
ncbi:MAG TPA: S8 family serine peptidase [Candidatus Elarobacter sp.]|nr:S8 family serine peptidase [Candidatus Elarobacter sp.]